MKFRVIYIIIAETIPNYFYKKILMSYELIYSILFTNVIANKF